MKLHIKKNKYVKRVLLSLLIFILTFSVISVIATVVFYHAAFPRSDESAIYSLSYSDIDADAYPFEKLSIPSGDNSLTGYYYSRGEPEALVVISAGFRESGSAHLCEMMTLVDSGYSVLCYDATGVGESEGSSTVGLSQPAVDLRSVLDHISGDAGMSSLPILLYGYSAGGYAAASCVDLPQVRAAVIVSGFESPTMLMRETARSYVGPLADIEYPFLALENSIVFGSYGNGRASENIRSADIPVAVYEGSDDKTIPPAVRLSRYLDISDEDITFTLCDEAPGNGHGDLWLSDEALAERRSSDPDPDTANTLDPTFTEELLRFYRSAL